MGLAPDPNSPDPAKSLSCPPLSVVAAWAAPTSKTLPILQLHAPYNLGELSCLFPVGPLDQSTLLSLSIVFGTIQPSSADYIYTNKLNITMTVRFMKCACEYAIAMHVEGLTSKRVRIEMECQCAVRC